MYTTIKGIIAATIVAVTTAFALAPAAQAAPGDSQFVRILDDLHMEVTNLPVLVHQAHAVCTALKEGYTLQQVAHFLYSEIGYSKGETSALMAAAIVAYCPESDPTFTTPESKRMLV